MPSWLPFVLGRIRALAAAREVIFTLKARRELSALRSGLDEGDACDVLARLSERDSLGRMRSKTTGEWLYLFRFSLQDEVLYLKVVLRSRCVVVSFHEDRPDQYE